MKKYLIIISVLTLILLVSQTGNAQPSDCKFRLGLQGTHFVSGLSGVIEISNPWALQGVLDFGADAVAVRLLNRFHQEAYWNAYFEGTVSFWNSDEHIGWWHDHGHDWDQRYHDHSLGLGFGLGIEYDWRGLEASLPPIGWNIELGAGLIPDYGLDIDIGLGVHWKF